MLRRGLPIPALVLGAVLTPAGARCATPSTPEPSPPPANPSSARIVRSEHRIPSTPGIEVFVVRVRPAGTPRGAAVFTHGAGSPASAVWDLPHGYSVLAALARQGIDAYSVDVRGFGGSTMPPALREPADAGPPAVRAEDVLPDVEAAVRFARSSSGHDSVDLVGWSWGSLVAGAYAGAQPDHVRRLVLFAPVFDRRWPARHRARGAWRTESRALHLKWLDPRREDPRIRRAYVEQLFRFVEGDELRLPNGPYRDVYGPDAPVWRPEAVRAETLVVRGSEDRASLRSHALALYDRLTHARRRAYLELEGVDHFGFRTRAGVGPLRSAILWFLTGADLSRRAEPGSTPAGAAGGADGGR